MTEESTYADPKDPRVVAAAREYFDLLDRGQAVDREQFIAQKPHIAQLLRTAIADEDERRRLQATEPPRHLTGGSTGAFARHGDTLPPPSRSGFGPAASTLSPGAQLGRYTIVRVLGRGAMGTVYLAMDTQLDRQVALKTPQFDQDPDLLERFHREARAAAALRHPNICPIYDFGQIDGTYFISMAYIEGEPLSTLVGTEQPQPVRRILTIALKIAQALQEAHERGIVHRDLKPANVMLDRRGEPIVMDFGLARQVSGPENVRLTQSGILVGTPAFMSPEQIEGELDRIGPASDQYSLGVVLYELFTQKLPFRGSSMAIIAQALVKEPPPPIQFRNDLNPRINAACLKMMAKVPEDRFPSMADVAAELSAILEDPSGKPTAAAAPAEPKPTLSPAQAAAKRRRQSLALQFLEKRSMTDDEICDIERSARREFDLRQYDKVAELIAQVPEEQRPARLQGLLADTRSKLAQIAPIVAAIDEAMNRHDAPAALRSADALLAIQPRHPRASEVKSQLKAPMLGDLGTKWRAVWIAACLALIVLAGLMVASFFSRQPDETNTPKPDANASSPDSSSK